MQLNQPKPPTETASTTGSEFINTEPAEMVPNLLTEIPASTPMVDQDGQPIVYQDGQPIV